MCRAAHAEPLVHVKLDTGTLDTTVAISKSFSLHGVEKFGY
jgi:hypothetical protein